MDNYQTRVRVTKNGKRRMIYQWIWDELHPNDPIKPGEVIHHINGDVADNRTENLEKLTDSAHRSLHAKILQPLKRWAELNPKAAREVNSRNIRKTIDRLRANPAKYIEWRRRLREATIAANKARRLDLTDEEREERRRQQTRAAMRRYRERHK